MPVIESAANPKWSSNTATSGPATEVRRRRETNPLNSTHDWSKQTLNICLDFYSLFSRISTSIAQTQVLFTISLIDFLNYEIDYFEK